MNCYDPDFYDPADPPNADYGQEGADYNPRDAEPDIDEAQEWADLPWGSDEDDNGFDRSDCMDDDLY